MLSRSFGSDAVELLIAKNQNAVCDWERDGVNGKKPNLCGHLYSYQDGSNSIWKIGDEGILWIIYM